MKDALGFAIGPLQAHETARLSQVIATTIGSLEYYNERAREEEVAKYTGDRLAESIRDDSNSILVARTHDTIVGFCISSYDAGLIWLAWFGVLPAARGQGIGGRLLAALSQTMTVRRAHKIWCDTRTANDKAQRVLEAFGFREIAQLRNHWYGQDFLLWEWPPADPV